MVAAVKSAAVSALVAASVRDRSTSAAQEVMSRRSEGRRPHLSRVFAGVWLHRHLPDGGELVDLLQRGLRPPSHRYDITADHEEDEDDDEEGGRSLASDLMVSAAWLQLSSCC